jgi:Mannosyltransferase putative
MLGGKAKYLVPALISIKALRSTGCTLPIELFFPSSERRPDDAVLDNLATTFNVHLRTLPTIPLLDQV